jgi:glycosyltransferase involved in cell wall biosynthesis
VAKDQNVRFRSGWFSDRSACYLAAGKPVVTQDTGFGDVLPVGRGLFAFRTMDDVVAALEDIGADYQAHSRAARAIAEEHLAVERVLTDLLTQAGLA